MSDAAIISALKKEIRDISFKLEAQRKIYLLWLLSGICIVSFVATFILLYINPQGIDLQYTVTFGALIPSIILYLILGRLYLGSSKEKLINMLCKAGGLKYREDGFFSVGSARKHTILPPHNRDRIETGLKGHHNGTDFSIQETFLSELKQDKKNKKRQKEYVRFWGILLRIPMNSSVYGHTVIMPQLVRQVFFARDFSGYQKIKTNDQKFERAFDVLTTDKVDTKVILSSSFKDQFLKTAKDLNSYWSEVSFKENEILFAFQRFRPLITMTPVWKPVTEKALRQNVDELQSIIRLIDVLKANRQLNL